MNGISTNPIVSANESIVEESVIEIGHQINPEEFLKTLLQLFLLYISCHLSLGTRTIQGSIFNSIVSQLTAHTHTNC